MVQILVGGRTEDKAVNLATLSGKQDLANRLFVSASNFMIIKFSTDASVERKGFRFVKEIGIIGYIFFKILLILNDLLKGFMENRATKLWWHIASITSRTILSISRISHAISRRS